MITVLLLIIIDTLGNSLWTGCTCEEPRVMVWMTPRHVACWDPWTGRRLLYSLSHRTVLKHSIDLKIVFDDDLLSC